MADPTEYITLPTGLRLVASSIADTDLARGRQTLRDRYDAMGFFYPEGSQNSCDPYAKFNNESNDHWSKHELAVIRIHSANVKGEIETYVRDPASGAVIGLEPVDWLGAAFAEDIIRGGIVRASACESLEQYRGWVALTKAVPFRRWLVQQRRRQPAADESKCRDWLLKAMLANPTRKVKAKPEWREDALRLYGVNVRAFNRAWNSAIKASGSTWNKPGAIMSTSNLLRPTLS